MIKEINILNKEEIKNITIDNVKFDVALKMHMDKLDKDIKALSAEFEQYKTIAKAVFGKDGGNGVFSTETRKSYNLNTDELIELIGKQKYEELKNKLSEKTYVHW